MRSRHAIYILLVAATLAGCGQMGPLYMPSGEQGAAAGQPPAAEQQPAARPATDADQS